MEFERNPNNGVTSMRCSLDEVKILSLAALMRTAKRTEEHLRPLEADKRIANTAMRQWATTISLDVNREFLGIVADSLKELSESYAQHIDTDSRAEAVRMFNEIKQEIEVMDFTDQITDCLPPHE